MPRGTTLTSYNPSLRDRITWFMQDFAGDDRGLRNYIGDRVRGGVDFVPGVGDAVGFDDAKRSFQAGNYGQAALEAGTSAVGTIPGVGDAVGAGIKGLSNAMFFGPQSKLWRSDMLDRAVEMQSRGAGLEDIHSETGLSLGWDKKPRGEISDHESSLSPDILNPGTYRLDDVLNHPEVFNHYPDLRDMAVHSIDDKTTGELGTYMAAPGNEHMRVHVPNIMSQPGDLGPEESIRSTVLHELMHAIQRREGFDPGFNPQAAFSTLYNHDSFAESLGQAKARQIMKKAKLDPNDPDSWELFIEKGLDEKIGGKVAFETYLRNAGETEARNVQTRMGMTPATRAKASPYSSADRHMLEQLTQDDILRGVYGPEGIKGVSLNTLRGTARRQR